MQRRFFLIGLSLVGILMLAAVVTAASETVAVAAYPGWIQSNADGFGDVSNRDVWALEAFGGQLYAGTNNSVNGAQLWRSADGMAWTNVITGGWGDSGVAVIEDLAEFGGHLYAGVGGTTGEVWRSPNGVDWTRVVTQGFGDANNSEVWSLGVFSNSLYAGVTNGATGAEVWRTANGVDWQQINADGFGNANTGSVIAFAVFADHLYASVPNGVTGAELWRTDGVAWTSVMTGGFGTANNEAVASLAVFDGQLYALTRNMSAGIEVWRTANGLDWTRVASGGLGNPHNNRGYGLVVYGSRLYLVTGNQTDGAEVWRTANGTTWEQIVSGGWGDLGNWGSYWGNSIATFGRQLFVGTIKPTTGGAEVWQYSPSTVYVAPGGNCGVAAPCYATLQAAVDAAITPDLIKVAAGTYRDVQVRSRNDVTATGVVTQVVYLSKTVAIEGGYTTVNWVAPDPEVNLTTLDAQGQGRVIYITGGIAPTIKGLRITGGNAAGLGGRLFSGLGLDAGGGVYVFGAAATLENNQVSNNTAADGGGIYLKSSAALLQGNTFTGNTSTSDGGAIAMADSPATLEGNTIVSNTSSWGGGLYLHSSPATLRHNTISANAATGRGGGGVFLWWSNAALVGNKITANTSRWNTNGGLHVFSSSPVLTNNAILGNQRGGLTIEGDSRPRLLHNTIAGNGADSIGMYIADYKSIFGDMMYSTVEMTNTILVSHTTGISITGGNTVTVNGLLWHSTPVTVVQSVTATVGLQNEHWGDPAFAVDGYHLTAASSAMNAGVETGVTDDIDQHLRPYGAAPDLGADEIIATPVTTNTGSTLIYTNTQALPTVVEIPANAVTEATTLVYTPVDSATAPAFAFAGSAFELDAYRNGALLSGFAFSVPVTITLHYADADVAGLDEASLKLNYWNSSANQWQDAATTCAPPSVYDRHPSENWLAVPICHLSQFALFGQHRIYLPLVLRN